jgi:hypothetical protein
MAFWCFVGGSAFLKALKRASRDVDRTWLEIVSKRHSQTACRSFDSACSQWLWMLSVQVACDAPFTSCATEAKEGSNREVHVIIGQSNEEAAVNDSCEGTMHAVELN